MRALALAGLVVASLARSVLSAEVAASKPIDQVTVYLHYRPTVDHELVDAVADVLRSFD
jgi:hypothetical protein